MNKVPKCKECEYHRYSRAWNENQYHSECFNHNIPENEIADDGHLIVSVFSKFIYSKDTKTSPKWCPLREKKINH